jgi:exopolysaccharide production protein ExoQ
MKRPIEILFLLAERIFMVAALVFFLGAVFPVLRNPAGVHLSVQASDPVLFVLQLAVYAVGLLFMVRARHRIWNALLLNPVLFALLIFMVMSSLWSEVPLFSLRRSIALLIMAMFGLYLGTRYDMKEQVRLVGIALSLCVFLSTVFIFVLPSYGIESGSNAGAWRGVFIQKNMLGLCMVIAVVTILYWKLGGLRGLIFKSLSIALAIYLLVGSLSAGSYVVMIISLILACAYLVFLFPRRKLIPIGILVATLLVVGGLYALSNAEAILLALGKNAALTGRVPLWHTLLGKISDRPFFGYGYAAFWSTQNRDVWAAMKWRPLKAHNGYIDLCLDLGLVGLGIFLLNSVIVIRRSIKTILSKRSFESQWPLMMLSIIFFYNVYESDFFAQNSFTWMLYVAITVATQRALQAEASFATQPAAPAPYEDYSTGSFPCPQ